jgi:hypothetical protein
MTPQDFFQAHVAWLQQGASHRVNFLLASNRSEANPFVMFASGDLQLGGANELRCTPVPFYFSDRLSTDPGDLEQPFNPKQTDPEGVSIDVLNGVLLRINPKNEGVIGRYSKFECDPNGLLACTSGLTKEMLLLSFRDTTFYPIP